MKFPCFEHNVTEKDPHYDQKAEAPFWRNGRLVVNPDTVKSFYNEAKAWYDKGLDFDQTIDKMHETSGLRKTTISKILASNRTARNISNAMWAKQAKYRSIKTAARIMAEQADTPTWAKAAGDLWDLSRRSATAFHGGVLPFSHARNLALGSPAEMAVWGRMVKNAYKFATPSEIGIGGFKIPFGKGEARWAKAWHDIQQTPEWEEAVRYGVEARPGDRPVGILANIAQGWGIRAFDALKMGRVELFHLLKDYAEGKRNYFVPPKIAEAFGVKQKFRELDEEALKMLAKQVNIATGAMHMSPNVARSLGTFSFAPKVWIARRMEAYAPIRYVARVGQMSANERAVANLGLKRWARHVITAAALLQVNDAINKVIGSKQRVNWTDFKSPGTLWRMNWGGHIVPFSPMMEVLRTPVVMTAALLNTRRQLKGQEAVSNAWEIGTREVLNALHPSIIHGLEAITGREMFGVPRHHRRLPFKGVAQLVRGEEPERDAPMGWPEYMAELGPIPMAAAAKEVFSPALTEEGIPKPQADKWVEALINSTLSGFGGMHAFEVSPKAAPQRTRYKRPPGTIK